MFAFVARHGDYLVPEGFRNLHSEMPETADPEYRDDVLRCSDWLVAKMQEARLSTERIEGNGHPIVYGEWLGAEGKPTILFYGHYDVQPVDPVDLWRHPPFEPTLEGDNLVARGATDDKGQSFAHLKAVASIMAEEARVLGPIHLPHTPRTE